MILDKGENHMPDAAITCPHCGVRLRPKKPIPPGKSVKCPQCHQSFTTEEQEEPAFDVVESADPPPAPLNKAKPKRRQEDDEQQQPAGDIDESPEPPPASPGKARLKRRQEDEDDDEPADDIGESPEPPPASSRKARPKRRNEDDEADDSERPRRRGKRKSKRPTKSNQGLIIGIVAGGMLVLLLIVGVVVLLIFFMGGGNYGKWEALVKKHAKIQDDLANVLQLVKDQPSAKKAVPEINGLTDQLEALAKETESLPKLTIDEKNRLTTGTDFVKDRESTLTNATKAMMGDI